MDDNPDQLRLLVEALREEGYRLTIAFDGAQGYARAVAMIPDLILLDVQMPKKDGFAVARLLKADAITAHIPVLFLSASADIQDRLTGLRAGAVDYILKPFQALEVIERVRIHLGLARDRRWSDATAWPAMEAETSARSGPEQSGAQAAGDSASRFSEGDMVLLRAAQRSIIDALDDPPKAADLARMLGVSERRIAHVFESCLGMTLFEFVRRERMLKAQSLLQRTSLNIVEIAAELGYSSAANFSTAFRDYLGESPSSFRKNMRKSN
ncbi:response regulator transcription factor [Allopusillimonas ginsengisoli]|nr:response regulator transcription factor [Allopusillimonas ginsengisoli]